MSIETDAWNRDNVVGRVVQAKIGDEIIKTVTRTHANTDDMGVDYVWVLAPKGKGKVELLDVTPYNGVGDLPDANRVSGYATCPICEDVLYRHQPDLEHLSKDGVPFLVRRCDGVSVKL